jgi:NAD(P)-dependent dehydrogenase (short-subunit alcohol dehydrogenase family)
MLNNPFDFSGKVALITGAAAGMGLDSTETLAGQNFRSAKSIVRSVAKA